MLLRRLALQRPHKVNGLSASKSCGLEPKRKLQHNLHVQIQRLIVSPPLRLNSVSEGHSDYTENHSIINSYSQAH